MEKRKEKRRSKVRQMKYTLILDAALQIFSQKGFHDTRLEDIAYEAGFSKASLYNYYGDKEEIFLHVATREYSALLERICGEGDFHLSPDSSIQKNLRRFFSAVFNSFGAHFAFVLAMEEFFVFTLMQTTSAKKHEEEMRVNYLQIKEQFTALLIDIIQAGKDRNEIHSSLSADQLTSLVEALVLGILKRWKEERRIASDISSMVEELVEFVGYGFRCMDK
jgi:AcrR family transcriptional regulator